MDAKNLKKVKQNKIERLNGLMEKYKAKAAWELVKSKETLTDEESAIVEKRLEELDKKKIK